MASKHFWLWFFFLFFCSNGEWRMAKAEWMKQKSNVMLKYYEYWIDFNLDNVALGISRNIEHKRIHEPMNKLKRRSRNRNKKIIYKTKYFTVYRAIINFVFSLFSNDPMCSTLFICTEKPYITILKLIPLSYIFCVRLLISLREFHWNFQFLWASYILFCRPVDDMPFCHFVVVVVECMVRLLRIINLESENCGFWHTFE